MIKFFPILLLTLCSGLFITQNMVAQNPLITNQFTADPSARVFEGKVYVYPSHDVPCGPGQGFIGFCMPDYHVFSSENLTEWTDHGVILSQDKVEWVDSTRYSLWAPDCIEKDGKYYFYFPAVGKDTVHHRGMRVGVAVSDKPYGPFIPEPKPIEGISGIDPNPFIDDDGKAYLYWASHRVLYGAELSPDMKSLASEPAEIEGLPEGFKEGPYLFKKDSVYYFTFPHVARKTERLAWSTGNHPLGPFKYGGVIMDESPIGCWTNHHSILEYKGQWYLFYHHNDLSPEFDKNRSIRVDSLFFEEDGSIRKVVPTFRGVGITKAGHNIQLDRYSEISKKGVSVEFLDSMNRQEGWIALFTKKGAWLRYNQVDFNDNTYTKAHLRVFTETGGKLEIRLNGKRITEISVEPTTGWETRTTGIDAPHAGLNDIIIRQKSEGNIRIDWLRFE